MLDFSNFVEGYVTGVVINDLEKAVEIFLRDRARATFVVKLKGVERFLVDEMLEQNIIDNVALWKGGNGADDFRSAVSWLVSGRGDEVGAQRFSSVILQVEQLIRQEERVLLRIEPVFGATVIALARTCSLEPIHTAPLDEAR
jgi:hypothetical protein